MIVFLVKFVKVLGLGSICLLLLSCGFHLAGKKKLISKAQTLRLAKIKNSSNTPYIDFLLEKKLKEKLETTDFYTETIAELELFITIKSADFSSETKEQSSGTFYRHHYKIDAQLFLDDLRNLQPAKTNKKFTGTSYLEFREESLEESRQRQLQLTATRDLAEQIFFFITK